ncbi:uncharacterized protein K460DRAFT_344705 [Cucurbitaria berberidis CBS 394.84]|uniref:Uncharacterized protein n=1 Tax=Cucurbitaria berberidis CBS 394.84 TaxID=1168544 RepID=A0A9P4GA45_9PLEO|nr:uncharacterized protein K460DRAFT_344705 [Cucurbitaria berberidis CBS 394.84]KAF1841661.1 hypothetical protein K460DRAFT_344705 [Cucurbitaria berberidis CBS 394.84]
MWRTTEPLSLPDSDRHPLNSTTPRFLQLSIEIRLQIYAQLVASARPFLIGRCQDKPRRSHNSSPRDFFPGEHHIERNDQPSRPTQPPITRVCRQIREESLPLFYSDNYFWLIHNEFQPDTNVSPRRNFDPWIAQTPRNMFDVMRHVSLCGYVAWPTRIMIDVDLKHRSITQVRSYSTYGDELKTYEVFVERIQAALTAEAHSDGITVLKSVLLVCDGIWTLSKEHVSAPPGLSRLRKPRSGPDYDW